MGVKLKDLLSHIPHIEISWGGLARFIGFILTVILVIYGIQTHDTAFVNTAWAGMGVIGIFQGRAWMKSRSKKTKSDDSAWWKKSNPPEDKGW